jgi:hypothetical protein
LHDVGQGSGVVQVMPGAHVLPVSQAGTHVGVGET